MPQGGQKRKKKKEKKKSNPFHVDTLKSEFSNIALTFSDLPKYIDFFPYLNWILLYILSCLDLLFTIPDNYYSVLNSLSILQLSWLKRILFERLWVDPTQNLS